MDALLILHEIRRPHLALQDIENLAEHLLTGLIPLWAAIVKAYFENNVSKSIHWHENYWPNHNR